MGTEVYVQELPKCDFCDKPAGYDGATRMGPWGYMCEEHFRQYGMGLGTGRGQKLIPRKALGEAERIRGEPEKELSFRMTEKDLEVATLEDVWYPVCPYCGAETPAEPDAHAVYCQACNRRFKIINPFFSNPGGIKGRYDMRPEEYASLAQALQAGREALERLEHPELQLRMTKYRSVAEQREFIGEPSDHELLLHFGIEETGSPGAVLNEATAKASPCSCFTYKGKDICWSRGIVGLLTQPQQGTYCVAGKAYKAQPALTKRYTTFAEAAEEAHKKIEAMPKGMPRLEVWLGEMGKALSKHGIEV